MKSYFVKRLLAIVLVMALLFSVAACKDDEVTKTDPETTSDEKNEGGDVKKPEVIDAFLDTILKEEQGQPDLEKEFEAKTGIKLEINQPAHSQYYDIMNVTFASGSIPDVVEISEQNYLKYASQNGLKDVTELVEASEIMKTIDQKYKDAIKVDGKMFGVPLQTGGGCVTYIRSDWLEKLNLEIPKTYDDLYKVMQAFKNNDPDGNGKNDTIPYTAVLEAENKLQDQYLRDFYWDATPDFKLVDGQWVDGFAQDSWKAALERVKKAYDDGLLDKEVFTNETSTCRDKLAANKVGIFSYWNNYWASRLEDKIQSTSDKNAKLLPIPAISETTYLNRAPLVTAITSACKNPEGVFKHFLEYMHDGGEGQIMFSFGVENVHWKKVGDAYEMLPRKEKPAEKFDKVWFSADNTVTPFKDGPLVPLDERVTKAIEAFNVKYEQMAIFPVSDTYTKKAPDIDKLRTELTAKAIIGTMTVDEVLAQYKKDAEGLEVEKILADFNGK